MPVEIKKSSDVKARTIWTLVMLFGFITIIASGHFWCVIFALFICTLIFKEILQLKRNYEREKKIPYFKTLNWYFFIVGCYYCFGTLFSEKLPKVLFTHHYIYMIFSKHDLISFFLWIPGFLTFVLTLEQGYYRY